MRFIIVDFRVEYIAESYLPQKQVTYPSDACCIFVLGPDLTEAGHGREGGLQLWQLFRHPLVRRRTLPTDSAKHLSVIADESDDGFTVILCDILGLIAGLVLAEVPKLETPILFG